MEIWRVLKCHTKNEQSENQHQLTKSDQMLSKLHKKNTEIKLLFFFFFLVDIPNGAF